MRRGDRVELAGSHGDRPRVHGAADLADGAVERLDGVVAAARVAAPPCVGAGVGHCVGGELRVVRADGRVEGVADRVVDGGALVGAQAHGVERRGDAREGVGFGGHVVVSVVRAARISRARSSASARVTTPGSCELRGDSKNARSSSNHTAQRSAK